MKAIRQLGLLMPLTLFACATAVTQDLSEPEDEAQGATGGSDSVIPSGGKSNGSGGTSSAGSSTSGTGTGPKAFGGTATSGGTDGAAAGEGSGGSAGSSSGGQASSGSGGTSSGSGGSSGASGSGGTSSGGTSGAGSGGKAGSGSGGSPVGPGDCSGTPLFMAGAATKYALNAKVVATCNGGTPCTQEQPPLQAGKAYEFSCIDQYNCGVVDPATTNWAIPPWDVVKACE